jgi:hypothetical protein
MPVFLIPEDHLISTFPPLTVAVLMIVGVSIGCGGEAGVDCLEVDGPPSFSVATASCVTPAGASAISLISRVVKESESLEPRDWSNSVVGPRNWRNS